MNQSANFVVKRKISKTMPTNNKENEYNNEDSVFNDYTGDTSLLFEDFISQKVQNPSYNMTIYAIYKL